MKRMLRSIFWDQFGRTFLVLATIAAIAMSVLAAVGCASTPTQREANIEAQRRVVEINDAIQHDPAASDAAKKQSRRLVEVVLGPAIDAQGGFDVVGLATSLGGLLPPPWNLIPALAVPVLVGLVQQRRLNAAKAATPAKETP